MFQVFYSLSKFSLTLKSFFYHKKNQNQILTVEYPIISISLNQTKEFLSNMRLFNDYFRFRV